MQRVLAIDAGTTGVTCLVLGPELEVLGRAYHEFRQHHPQPGWVEHDPDEIWETTLAAARDAIRDARIQPHHLAAVGITNQRETTVLWDRGSGKPVHPAIVWQDRRTSARCRGLRAEHGKAIRQRTGLVLDPYFSATKLEWLLQNVRGARKKAEKGQLAFGTVDTWLAWRLTGGAVHATDTTNASRTLLWDIHKGDWDDHLLDLFGIPPAVLPDVHASAHDFGPSEARHLGHAIPLTALVGDQQAALFGQQCTRAGEAKCTYGTGAFLLQHTGGAAMRSQHGLLTTRAAQVTGSPQYALEGSVFTAGSAIQWLRDGLTLIASGQELDALAAQAPDTAGLTFVPAFSGLGAPHWDPDARGAWLGLTAAVETRHVARATLEAIALQCYDVIEAMQEDSGTRIPALRVDGGAARSDPLLQIQADLLQRQVVRPKNLETTALGAGMLAGIGAGAWSATDLRHRRDEDAVLRPKAKKKHVEKMVAKWHQAVAATRTFV